MYPLFSAFDRNLAFFSAFHKNVALFKIFSTPIVEIFYLDKVATIIMILNIQNVRG